MSGNAAFELELVTSVPRTVVRGKNFLARSGIQTAFLALSLFVISSALLFLFVLIAQLILDGWPRLEGSFFTQGPSRKAEIAGVYPALMGSLWLMGIVAVFAVPLGVGAAVYLEEYASKNKLTSFIELNIANLAGVPSIIYGLLGLQLFVRMLQLDRSVLAGGLTLSLVILPVIIIATREALRNVPRALREGALALGATQWQSIAHHVLPNATPGILTGCILAFSRAIGETAPLITMGALTYVAFAPQSPLSPFTALPIQAFNWISRPQAAFHTNAAAAISILLVVLLAFNIIAIVLRAKLERRS